MSWAFNELVWWLAWNKWSLLSRFFYVGVQLRLVDIESSHGWFVWMMRRGYQAKLQRRRAMYVYLTWVHPPFKRYLKGRSK